MRKPNNEEDDEVVDDEVGDDEVGNDEVDEFEANVKVDNVVDDDNNDIKQALNMIPPSPDTKPKPPTNNDVLQYKNCKLQLKEKTFWLLGMNPCCVME